MCQIASTNTLVLCFRLIFFNLGSRTCFAHWQHSAPMKATSQLPIPIHLIPLTWTGILAGKAFSSITTFNHCITLICTNTSIMLFTSYPFSSMGLQVANDLIVHHFGSLNKQTCARSSWNVCSKQLWKVFLYKGLDALERHQWGMAVSGVRCIWRM